MNSRNKTYFLKWKVDSIGLIEDYTCKKICETEDTVIGICQRKAKREKILEKIR
jgi:hypothetical protein